MQKTISLTSTDGDFVRWWSAFLSSAMLWFYSPVSEDQVTGITGLSTCKIWPARYSTYLCRSRQPFISSFIGLLSVPYNNWSSQRYHWYPTSIATVAVAACFVIIYGALLWQARTPRSSSQNTTTINTREYATSVCNTPCRRDTNTDLQWHRLVEVNRPGQKHDSSFQIQMDIDWETETLAGTPDSFNH
jgi:hypothetical protein